MIHLGEKVSVIMQFADGRVVEMPNVITTQITYEMPFEGTLTYDIHLSGYGEFYEHRKEFETILEERQSANEWACNYCGRPNDMDIAVKVCESCGGARSILL